MADGMGQGPSSGSIARALRFSAGIVQGSMMKTLVLHNDHPRKDLLSHDNGLGEGLPIHWMP